MINNSITIRSNTNINFFVKFTRHSNKGAWNAHTSKSLVGAFNELSEMVVGNVIVLEGDEFTVIEETNKLN
ncbi:hypothetical protein [Vibrio sp. 10N.261.55.A7]|uniref:hypothetical protein n=1 Tax=Vibrio sp. 10N.261.55.A7 TaxID=1880851 RepID=UPI000C84EDD5|nr:hypothetical protein [Vibrio sp. 10N.261.55.A7]PMJ98403.1 hypothetical protein BCU12_21815 [Vibrio sp. 10N.261.55.A7]